MVMVSKRELNCLDVLARLDSGKLKAIRSSRQMR
jgi:hypothetical protein